MRICVTIAVARPDGRLDQLPGAIEASHDILQWATAAQFDKAVAITDENVGCQEKFVDLWEAQKTKRSALVACSAVTVADLTMVLTELLGNPAEIIDHFVFHFAGHGFAGNMDNQFLLLTNWHRKPTEAIDVSVFAHLLQYYQPKRVSLFLDACRTAKPASAIELSGHGILDVTDELPLEFLEDRFRASKAGSEAYMLKDPLGGPSKCLFTTVLVQALGGKMREAVQARGPHQVVVSAGVYRALKKSFGDLATRLDLRLDPSLKPGFVDPDDVYSQLPIKFTPPDLPKLQIKSVADASRGRVAVKNPFGSAASKITLSKECQKGQDNWKKNDRQEELLQGYATEERPSHFETGAGVAVVGEKATSDPAVTPPARATRDRLLAKATWWRLDEDTAQQHLKEPRSLLIELENGTWVGAAALPDMILTISIGTNGESQEDRENRNVGAVSAIYRTVEGYAPDVAETSRVAETLTSQLRRGGFSAADASSVAARVGGLKHANPILGSIAAYLYDSAGDRDSIRRIAWLYPRFHQAIPFDVALLAGLRGERTSNGRIHVDLPALPARDPRTDEERNYAEHFSARSEYKCVPVAGGFPWFQQGWSLLKVSRLPINPSVASLVPHVLPFPFTTLDAEGGQRLAKLIRDGEV